MSQPTLLLVFCLALVLAQAGRAQPGVPCPRTPAFDAMALEADPLKDVKNLARARHALAGAERRQLLQAQFRAARTVFETRAREFLAGRGTLEFLWASIPRYAEAQRALSDTAAERLAVQEWHWLVLWAIEDVIREWFEAGRIDTKQYLEARYMRLGAEAALVPAGRDVRATHVSLPKVAAVTQLIDQPRDVSGGGSTTMKELAQAKFEALRTDPREWTRQRHQAISWSFRARLRNFLAGRGTLNFLQRAALRLRDAELALTDREVDRLAALESYWLRTRQFHDVNGERFRAGRIPLQDLMDTRHALLGAEAALIRAWSKREGTRTSAAPLTNNEVQRGDFYDVMDYDLPNLKAVARAKFEALRGDPNELARGRLQAARVDYLAREKEFLDGRGTLAFMLQVARRLREAEIAVAGTEAGRTASRERYWARLKQTHDVTMERFQARRIPIQDVAEVAFLLHEAEIALIGARARQGKK